MKRTKSIAAVSALSAALVMGSVTSPAGASEREAIDRGVSHSLTPALIAPGLGSYSSTYGGTVYQNYTSTWTVCSLSNPDRSAGFEGMDTEIRLGFSAKDKKSVSESLFLFSSAAAAKKTFTKLQRDIKKCSGTSLERNDLGGDLGVIEWQARVSHGTMNAVSGVPTLTVDNDWSNTTDVSEFRQDEFSTYSLVDDAIVAVTYRRSPGGSASAGEKRGAQVTTKAAIEKYQGRLPVKTGSIQASYSRSTAALIDKSDVPTSLGASSTIKADQIDLESSKRRIWMCDPEGKQFSDEANTVPYIGITSNPVTVSSEYSAGKSGYVSEAIMDFGSMAKAEKAFADMQKQARSCNGTFTEQVSGTDDESGAPFSGTITRAISVSKADVAGSTPSIVIDSQTRVQVPATDPARSTSQYEVITLSGSRVVWMKYGKDNQIAAKQKASVRELAQTAVAQLR